MTGRCTCSDNISSVARRSRYRRRRSLTGAHGHSPEDVPSGGSSGIVCRVEVLSDSEAAGEELIGGTWIGQEYYRHWSRCSREVRTSSVDATLFFFPVSSEKEAGEGVAEKTGHFLPQCRFQPRKMAGLAVRQRPVRLKENGTESLFNISARPRNACWECPGPITVTRPAIQ